ncbi:hypothetical protein BKA70DRAFT_1218495 [Coprinopsis sp. MPI-PUGE-AT-0042]|nr:hypothetical protein BKA70DRAFT_1218495 [Coprinopsis sp. MPI-PUGE-AT-0042]
MADGNFSTRGERATSMDFTLEYMQVTPSQMQLVTAFDIACQYGRSPAYLRDRDRSPFFHSEGPGILRSSLYHNMLDLLSRGSWHNASEVPASTWKERPFHIAPVNKKEIGNLKHRSDMQGAVNWRALHPTPLWKSRPGEGITGKEGMWMAISALSQLAPIANRTMGAMGLGNPRSRAKEWNLSRALNLRRTTVSLFLSNYSRFQFVCHLIPTFKPLLACLRAENGHPCKGLIALHPLQDTSLHAIQKRDPPPSQVPLLSNAIAPTTLSSEV